VGTNLIHSRDNACSAIVNSSSGGKMKRVRCPREISAARAGGLPAESKKLEPLDKPGSNAGGIFADACISIGPSRAATIDIGQEK
jgi:hypothetical protein